jgi:hypothetical protein
VYRLEHKKNDTILPSNIREIVRKSLLERCGKMFYSQITLVDLTIVIPLAQKKIKQDLIAEGIVRKGEIKYYYYFLFTESPNIQYRFNMALDVQGNILSEWTIPKLKNNDYRKIVSFCEAAYIARNDKKAEVILLNDLNLIYDSKLNHLGWRATVGYKLHQKDEHFKSYRLTINAFDGEIIDRWDANVIKYDSPTHK